MFMKVGLGIVVLFAGLLLFIATRPADFRIERTAVIDAPAEIVFPLVNDFHRWGEWSPYDKRDPAMKKSYEGPAAGVGASYTWAGNNDVGEGRCTITESKPNELVSMTLVFMKPMSGTSQATFKLTPSGAGTQVRWSIEGKNGFVQKAVCLVLDMDKMVGTDFEKGLASLNEFAQADAKKAVPGTTK